MRPRLRFNYEYSDEELQEIARRTAAVAEKALDVQVVVNVNYEDQGIRPAGCVFQWT